MGRRLWTPLAAAALLLSACGGGSGAGKGGTISGSVAGNAFNRIAASYWIGAPSPGSPPVILFLLETPLDCAALSVINWDKTIGDSQVLEIGLAEAATRTFTAPTEAYVAYLRGALNPDADSATITVTDLNPSTSIAGSFDAQYRADSLRGTFNATYCATGVEP